jgi:hypothetical protein
MYCPEATFYAGTIGLTSELDHQLFVGRMGLLKACRGGRGSDPGANGGFAPGSHGYPATRGGAAIL